MDIYTSILNIINHEPDLERKLDMLTAIGITSKNDETFKTCEALREQILDSEESKNKR
jgi:hypothetical protein